MAHHIIPRPFIDAPLRGALRRGVTAEALLRRAGIAENALDKPDAGLSNGDYARLMATLWVMTNDEYMGCAPVASPYGTFAMMCKAIISCSSLEHALHRARRFYALFDQAPEILLHKDEQLTRLEIRHEPAFDVVWYAYFAPYSMERHADLIASAQFAEGVRVSTLGRTLDGQEIDLVTVGEPNPAKLQAWIIARQHPGETMAEWCVEGLLERLLDDNDPVARMLRARCVFRIVPNMNPDGARRGHLRTNAIGVNLNREWNKASLESGPEVFHALAAMRESGVDFFLDCHGDEAIPYNFIAGPEGVPSFNPKQGERLAAYKAALMRANPDFQTTHGYPLDAPRAANMSIATNYVAETFGCLAMTLEMPFKDNDGLPDPDHGWSPERSAKLGASQLDALLAVVDLLR